MLDDDSTELLRVLLAQVELITDADLFLKLHGFTLESYFSNRKLFATTCRQHADHIEQFVKGSGIARTVGGSVSIAAGGVAILGIILAPFTAAASLGLTIGGVAGGMLGAGTTLTAGIVKDTNIRADQEKIEKALESFENQEKVIGVLLRGVHENLDLMSKFKKQGTTVSGTALKGLAGAGGLAVKGLRLGHSISATAVTSGKLARFASNVRHFLHADAATFRSIAESAAAPGLFGKAVVAAGTTTAKVFSGVFAAFGIGLGIWDVVNGAKDINGSEVAKAYRDFADEYDESTVNLVVGIKQLSKLLYQDCVS